MRNLVDKPLQKMIKISEILKNKIFSSLACKLNISLI